MIIAPLQAWGVGDIIFCQTLANDWQKDGVLFLYLPHPKQTYWLPWNNRKHVNILTGEMIQDYLRHKGYTKIFVTGCDLNHSFAVIAEKI
jgi:nicotinamidase-related amidase